MVEVVFLRITLPPHPNQLSNRRRVKLYHPLRDWIVPSESYIWETAKRNRRESGLGSAAHWRDHSLSRNRTFRVVGVALRWVLRYLADFLSATYRRGVHLRRRYYFGLRSVARMDAGTHALHLFLPIGSGWFIYRSTLLSRGWGPLRWVSALQENQPNRPSIYL